MGNQQPSTLEERIYMLSKNAVFGDGSIWKHPECVNRKLIFTSTNRELLEVKINIAPEIFTSGITLIDTTNHKGRFPNAKPLYRLASIVNPIITSVYNIGKDELIKELTTEDIALWYLDDGCLIKRKDANSNRYMICIGDSANSINRQNLLEAKLEQLFGTKWGSIRLNNSKATTNNKTWFIPVKVAEEVILPLAAKYNIMKYKFPTR